MSLITRLDLLTKRIAQEFKSVRTSLSTKFGDDDVIMNTNPFGGRKLYINSINDAMFRAADRWTVTGNFYSTATDELVGPVSTGSLAAMFDGSYETYLSVPVGQYAVVTIDAGAGFGGYVYGDIIVSHYNTRHTASIDVRVHNVSYAPHGLGWHSLTVTEMPTAAPASQLIRKAYNPIHGLNKIELTFRAPTSGTLEGGISQIEWRLDRPGTAEMPVFDKYRAQNIYSNTSWKDSTGVKASITATGIADFTGLRRGGSDVVITTDTRMTNARTPTGAAGGHLTGTYPNPKVSKVGYTDSRATDTIPNDYNGVAQWSFKRTDSIGLPDGSSTTYAFLYGFRAYVDNSGGLSREYAYVSSGPNAGNTYRRTGNTTTWGSWVKIEDSTKSPIFEGDSPVLSVNDQTGVVVLDAEDVGAVPATRMISGEGPPEGYVAAPVGTLYTDIYSYAGATTWVKHSGGTGKTGWSVVYGNYLETTVSGTVDNTGVATYTFGSSDAFISGHWGPKASATPKAEFFSVSVQRINQTVRMILTNIEAKVNNPTGGIRIPISTSGSSTIDTIISPIYNSTNTLRHEFVDINSNSVNVPTASIGDHFGLITGTRPRELKWDTTVTSWPKPTIQFTDIAAHPKILEQPESGRVITFLQPHNGVILVGYGDWNADTGPVAVVGYDEVTANPVTLLGQVPSEALDRCRIIDGFAYLPWVDPILPTEMPIGEPNGGFTTDRSGTWENVVAGEMIHTFDVAKINGKIHVCGSIGTNSGNGVGVVYREDGPGVWTEVLRGSVEVPTSRFYSFTYNEIQGRTYVQNIQGSTGTSPNITYPDTWYINDGSSTWVNSPTMTKYVSISTDETTSFPFWVQTNTSRTSFADNGQYWWMTEPNNPYPKIVQRRLKGPLT